ncbi:MAG: xanthine dehydrogenase family protein molybdopterin-binding subunit [Burkholderiales bacterium]|nr:xanthine dehydrogenase family protein molybdopterin-binding subunit [Burkholderiales bacterium]
MDTPDPSALIGKPIPRREDQRLLTGRGRYSDDIHLPGEARAAITRSPHAHARIVAIDTRAALAVPGVLAVYTCADLLADGVQAIAPDYSFLGPVQVQRTLPDVVLENRDGAPIYDSPYHLLARDRVRFAGQSVAMVVAESAMAAKDGAEAVEVQYQPLPSVTDTRDAAKPGAPRLWEHAASNVCLDAEHGDAAATDAAFAAAAHVVRFETWISRVTGVPMEPRTAVADYDAASGRCTLYAGSGGTNRQKREIAAVLGVPMDKVRVLAYDIGGNFGTKNSLYPEFPLLCWASKRLGRPLKWTCDRSEAFLSDYQGRDLAVEAELALDAGGRFLALRLSNLSNLGAHAASIIPLRKGVSIMTGQYRIPAARVRARGVLSNTPATIPYRSAGRPEAIYVLERLIELAARRTGIDALELRRRNLVRADEHPYRNASGVAYDNGDYPRSMESALSVSDWAGFPARREASRRRGMLRGIGIANYIEITTGFPREWSEISVLPESAQGGEIEVAVGTLSSGQGHETSFTQCVADWLGVPLERVRLVQGDTDRVPVGGGSHSGRSMRLAGVVMGKASQAIIEKGRRIAAHRLEAAPPDIEFARGRFTVKGTDRSLGLFEAALAANGDGSLPRELQGPLSAQHEEMFTVAGFPYGTQVCEVEIDPETGAVQIVAYSAVDDVGRAINPLILDGQTHGAMVQGAGQILGEHCHYERESGQLLSGSLMDYPLPRADQFPSFVTELMEIPAPGNPLGVRAGGEGGTTPALAVLTNAIVDALSAFGVEHLEMPATPERVWRAIQDKKTGTTWLGGCIEPGSSPALVPGRPARS